MLVLVSFVLVLAAAVTLVVGLLQSGLTLIYLSIGCSVLAGVVLAVAVLRGRPEPRPATAGRAFTPPQRAEVPAGVGASSTTAQTASSWSAGAATVSTPTGPPPPPPPPAREPERASGEDLATRAAGSALLGRLRGRRAGQETEAAAAPTPAPAEPAADAAATSTPVSDDGDRTMAMPVTPGGPEDDDFPVPDYDRMRATELLAMLPDLDRNQLEAVRERESAGKNRFTIMSRIDALLAAKESPGWDVGDDWEEEPVGVDAESEAVVIEAAAIREEDDFGATDLDMDLEGEVEDDEVAELVSPPGSRAGGAFPIAGYETLTVGQILPRLSELDVEELAQVRAREQQGRNRGTILDRVDRLQARAGTGGGALAMPAATPTSRRSTARKAPAVSKTTAPAVKATRSRAAKAAKVAPEPKAGAIKGGTKRTPAKKSAAATPLPAATPPATPRRAARSAKTAAAPPAPAAATPAKEAVKKARAKKAPAAAKAPAKRTTKRP